MFPHERILHGVSQLTMLSMRPPQNRKLPCRGVVKREQLEPPIRSSGGCGLLLNKLKVPLLSYVWCQSKSRGASPGRHRVIGH
jgi:hypothetical protein